MKAERVKRAQILESEGDRQSAINRAEGEKASVVLAAEAEKDEQVLRAEGEAKALVAVADAQAKALVMVGEAADTPAGQKAVQLGHAAMTITKYLRFEVEEIRPSIQHVITPYHPFSQRLCGERILARDS